MKTAVRCETCRWWLWKSREESMHGGSCFRFPPTCGPMGEFELAPETERFDYCGEWAHDPRRFEVERWRQDRDHPHLDKTASDIRNRATGETLPVLWPWEQGDE